MPTVRVPVDLRNPRVSTLAGNAFWTVRGLTAWDAGWWEFLAAGDVDGRAYGVVTVPKNVAATPNPALVLALAANATAGVTRMSVATVNVAAGATLNPAGLNAEVAQDLTVPATAYQRFDARFPAAGNLATTVTADSLVVVEVTHHGSHANDTLAVNTVLAAAWLQVDI